MNTTTLRKRGLSNVDKCDVKNYKLNTSASLQNEFDKRLKEMKRNKNQGFDMSTLKLNEVRKGNAYFNGQKVKPTKRKKNKITKGNSSVSSKNKEDPFRGFEYTSPFKSIETLQKDIESW